MLTNVWIWKSILFIKKNIQFIIKLRELIIKVFNYLNFTQFNFGKLLLLILKQHIFFITILKIYNLQYKNVSQANKKYTLVIRTWIIWLNKRIKRNERPFFITNCSLFSF